MKQLTVVKIAAMVDGFADRVFGLLMFHSFGSIHSGALLIPSLLACSALLQTITDRNEWICS
jgi:hypothetical protein